MSSQMSHKLSVEIISLHEQALWPCSHSQTDVMTPQKQSHSFNHSELAKYHAKKRRVKAKLAQTKTLFGKSDRCNVDFVITTD